MSGGRDDALDVVKGVLVLLMVYYHWLNYFVGLQWAGYRYLRFLTPSFILITGYLVGHVYLRRYVADDVRLWQRLSYRGVKLLLLFVLLNVVVELSLGLWPLPILASWPFAQAVWIGGEGAGAFNILVSIGYFLMLTPGIIWLVHRLRLSLGSAAVVALLATMVAAANGFENAHVDLLAIALLGLAAGSGRSSVLFYATKHPVWAVAAYALNVVAVTRWNVPFALQAVGVCITTVLLYVLASTRLRTGPVRAALIELGQYSLLAYVVQIAILQSWRRAVDVSALSRVESLAILAGAAIMTWGIVRLVRVIRLCAPFADRLYRTVFA